MRSLRPLIILLAVLAAVTGCGSPKLASTPNLFLRSDYDPFPDVPPELQSNEVTLYYITDRARTDDPEDPTDPVRYGYQRERSIAVGTVQVSIGDDISWDTLVAESLTQRRSENLRLRVDEITEVVRGAPSVTRFVMIDGRVVPNPEMLATRERTTSTFNRLLSERLAMSRRKEVFVFIHGFNNTFEQACYRQAQLWHFLGRVGVPLVYTWPAGRPGLLRGYQFDRESSEFTVFHLRNALELLANCPDVEKIHIVAHSRGTDPAMAALRELHIGARAQGLDTRTRYKIGTVVLAAADIDFDVVSTRIGAEGLHLVPERLVMYLSEDDRALGIATWLSAGVRRLGQLTMGDLSETARQSMALFPQLQFVDVEVTLDWLGHGYFISNPAVLSDLMLVLRDNALPGAEHGRPLAGGGEEFWRLGPDYPQFGEARSNE